MTDAWTHTIDGLLEGAVSAGTVPGAAAVVAGREGVRYETAAGVETDAVWRIASMTKPIVSVAALQLVEEGSLDLDEPVASYLPAFGELQVLDGFDGDTPRLRAPSRQATVRELFTHTAGHGYFFASPDLVRYHEVTGTPDVFTGLRGCLGVPLVNDPGTCFEYGINIDWLGQVIESVDGRDLGASLDARVLAPLGMTDTTFSPNAGQRFRTIPVHHRTPEGGIVAGDIDLSSEPEYLAGGHGLYSTARDYGRFMASMLNDGELDGARVLRPETVALAFSDQLSPIAYPERVETAVPDLMNDIESLPVKQGWGYGFHLTLEDLPQLRRAGSGDWAGLFNTYFWIDRSSGIAGAFFTQLLPFFDGGVLETAIGLEGAVYAGVTAETPTTAS